MGLSKFCSICKNYPCTCHNNYSLSSSQSLTSGSMIFHSPSSDIVISLVSKNHKWEFVNDGSIRYNGKILCMPKDFIEKWEERRNK